MYEPKTGKITAIGPDHPLFDRELAEVMKQISQREELEKELAELREKIKSRLNPKKVPKK